METQRRLHRPFPASAFVLPGIEPLLEPSGDRALAQALADNSRDPVVVLDEDLTVVAASGSFYRLFGLTRQYVQGRRFFALTGDRWNIAALGLLLEQAASPERRCKLVKLSRIFQGLGDACCC